MRSASLLALALAVSLLAVPLAGADHLDPAFDTCTYEAGRGVGSATPFLTLNDPTGQSADGTWDVGTCFWSFPDAGGTTETLLPGEPGFTVPGEYVRGRLSVEDALYGSDVGGTLCVDNNLNKVCGELEEGEKMVEFCGGAYGPWDATGDSDGDGHVDVGGHVAVWLNGAWGQPMDCPKSANPVGATRGTMTLHLS